MQCPTNQIQGELRAFLSDTTKQQPCNGMCLRGVPVADHTPIIFRTGALMLCDIADSTLTEPLLEKRHPEKVVVFRVEFIVWCGDSISGWTLFTTWTCYIALTEILLLVALSDHPFMEAFLRWKDG